MGYRTYVAAALAALAASGAQAQTAPAQGAQVPTRAELEKQIDESFGRIDANKDGAMSREEVRALEARILQQASESVQKQVEQQFGKLDTDKNGQLSLAEFKAAAIIRDKPNPDAAIARMDSNKDGKISLAEYKQRNLGAFDQADANKDGRLSPEEQRGGASR